MSGMADGGAAGKRRPLSVMIGLMADKKGRGGEPDGDEGDEEGEGYEPDEGELQACHDVIDAMAKRDPRMLSEALHHWIELAGYGARDEEKG